MMAISLLMASRLIEVPPFEKDEEKPPYLKQISDSGKFTFSHPKVRAILVFYIFFYFFFRTGFWFYQPYFQSVNIDVTLFGVIFALLNIVATLASRYADKFILVTKGFSLIALAFLTALSFILLGLSPPHWIGVSFIGLQQLSRGFYTPPLFLRYINKQIPSNKRATIISFNSLMGNLFSALLYPVVGILMDNMSILNLQLMMGGCIMMSGVVYFYFHLKKSTLA